jgi:hypothetical protein
MLRQLLALLFCAHALAATPTTPAVNSPLTDYGHLTALAVNLGATGDQATIALPSWVTAYQILGISVTNCSTTPVLAQIAMFTGAGGIGTTIVAAGTITGATSAALILPQTLAGTVATTRLTAVSLFVRVTVANVAALTCDVNVRIQDLS